MLKVKKGDKVIVKGFTGIKLGVFEVDSATKKTITVLKKNGDEMVFDKKTGKQVNVEEGKEKYANSAMEDDGSFVPPTRGGKKKSKKEDKPVAKKSKKEEPEDEEDDVDDEDEEPAPKKSKKPVKKSKHDDDDDDNFEEVDD